MLRQGGDGARECVLRNDLHRHDHAAPRLGMCRTVRNPTDVDQSVAAAVAA